jgi:hypothetical protein
MKSIIAELLRQWNVQCAVYRRGFARIHTAIGDTDSEIGFALRSEIAESNTKKTARERALVQSSRAYYRTLYSKQDRAKKP